MLNEIPKVILIAIIRALLGEIFPEIRAIAVSYNDKRELLIRYYLEREPTEDDYDSLGMVMTEVLSDVTPDMINNVKEECIKSLLPFNKLDVLGGLVYARYEREIE